MEIKPTPAKHLIPVDEILSQARAKAETELPISLVVVGHVDAGKSTLMGRMLLEFGHISERVHQNHERASQRIGKGSFSYAWALDSSEAERERCVLTDQRHYHRRCARHIPHPKAYIPPARCTRTPRLCAQHDFRCVAGGCGCACRRRLPRRVRVWL